VRRFEDNLSPDYPVNVILLGAANRVQSVKYLRAAARNLGFSLAIHSVERSSSHHYPIAHEARVIAGPNFDSERAMSFLDSLVEDYDQPIIVPFMDSAAVMLATWGEVRNYQQAVVSPDSLKLSDKAQLKVFARDLNVPVVPNTDGRFPKIVKRSTGYGSRFQWIASDESELATIRSINSDSIVEDFLNGTESTVDVYVSRAGHVVQMVARDRLSVEAGEVTHTRTRHADKFEFECCIKLLTGGWRAKGPICYQFLLTEGRKLLLECNPRFAGGSTASMAAGWSAWSWILMEYVAGKPAIGSSLEHVDVVRSRVDHIWRVQ